MNASNSILNPSPYTTVEGELIACHECDLLHCIKHMPGGGKASCIRCGAFLYQSVPNSLDKALALNLTAFMLFIIANIFPFISLKLSGRIEENFLISGALAFYKLGMGEVGLLVFLTAILFPLITIIGMIYILLPMKFGVYPWKAARAVRLVRGLTPWNLLAVCMLGVLIAIVKLLDLATIIPGIGLYSFAALVIVSTAANANLDSLLIWPPMRFDPSLKSGITAAERGLLSCHTCSLLVPETRFDDHHHHECPRCGNSLHTRKTNSIARTMALVIAAALLLIPANLYPVMTVIRFGQGAPDTILSGVIHLIEGGMWPLAMIVFFASIVVPVLKLIALTFFMITVQNKSQWRPRDRTSLYRVTEVVGAWSMVDIFLLAILVALVNLDALATIRPGPGAAFFGAAVVTTMLAAHSFDPRLIWDNMER